MSVLGSSVSCEPKLILFDCDGTLTNSHGLIVAAMQNAFSEVGLPIPPDGDVASVIGLSLQAAVERLLGEAVEDALMQNILLAYRDYYHAHEESIVLFSGVRSTLDQLRARGYWLGVVTGKSRAGLMRVLDLFQLHDHFLVYRTADCTHSKPHPAMVLECMDEVGLTAESTTVVGDALFDLQMSAAAATPFIGVSFGVESANGLKVAGASIVVDSFSELLVCFPELHQSVR